jgi:hypothetical protein
MPSWLVTMDCKVRKTVVVERDDPDEAWSEPWRNATDEQEVDLIDWTVVNVERIE